MKTYNDIYFTVRKLLREHEIEGADLEARLICAAACGKEVAEFLRDRGMYITENDYVDAVKNMVRRRLEGEPVAYITGSWEFYGLPMNVSRDVLIPRIDTEVLVDRALEFCRTRESVRVLDLCGGSGCIGIAIAANAKNARVVLGDKSYKALAVGRSNVLLNNVSQCVTSIELDALEYPDEIIGKFDLIVSNPPYIPQGDIPGLDTSVREYEPYMALDGGVSGLVFYRSISDKYRRVLKPGGALMYEVGINQASDVSEIMKQNGFTEIKTTKDTLDIDRVVQGIYDNGGN